MTLTVNGKPVDLDDGEDRVADLLRACRLADAPCAVEVNETVVPHREHATHRLRSGDRVEIVTFVGGG